MCVFVLISAVLQVDIIKPNITELVQMASYCVNYGLITNGKALVSNTIANIVASRVDSNPDDIDTADLRLLAKAIYQVMDAAPPAVNTHAVPGRSADASGGSAEAGAEAAAGASSWLGSVFGRVQQDTTGTSAFVNPTAAVKAAMAPATATATAVPNVAASKSDKLEKLVTGKHVIVSLGKRGVLWCGPVSAVCGADLASHQAVSDGSLVVDETIFAASVLIPSRPIDPADVVHTNGAGDALCAGIISECIYQDKLQRGEVLASQQQGVEPQQYEDQHPQPTEQQHRSQQRSKRVLPDGGCIRKGLLNAHAWIVAR